MSLRETETECAANAVAPRVSLNDIEAAIGAVYHLTADKAIGDAPQLPELGLLSICLVVMRNGFTVVGKSAPASAANFNADLGRKLAYEDAIRQLWPLMGFELRERLARG
jgi:Phage protein (N4 Gp49/phage Sf6 gene 66) family